jgi:DNA polymerase III sliding clamp (beta) subunit (PCNA family)
MLITEREVKDMSTTITLDASELERVLVNGALFAAPAKDYLPALEVVRFTWDGDTLYTVATNRYVLSMERVDYHGDGNTEGRDDFSIGTADAKRVVSLLKTIRLAGFPVAVKYDSEARKATFVIDGDTLIVTTEHGEFPKWRSLVPAEDEGEPVGAITLGAQWLALFAKVKAHKGSPVRFGFNTATKPVRVTIGEAFKAIVIPIRDATA